MKNQRYVWAAAVLLVVSAGAFVLRNPAAGQEDLQGQIMTRMRTTLEKSDPGQHNHAGHGVQTEADAAVVCGVRVYGYEPAEVATLTEVKTVYGFHLCGVAEKNRPWDVAVKLAGPVILDMATDPPGIQAVEATEQVPFIDRLKQMFPPKYADLAQKEALAEPEMAELRRRYDDAAGF